jgi:hypothetical protein
MAEHISHLSWPKDDMPPILPNSSPLTCHSLGFARISWYNFVAIFGTVLIYSSNIGGATEPGSFPKRLTQETRVSMAI